jgi:hypothetical protein
MQILAQLAEALTTCMGGAVIARVLWPIMLEHRASQQKE